MAVMNIGHYRAGWMPSGSPDKTGRGRMILRGEAGWLRTAHPQMHAAEPVREREGT